MPINFLLVACDRHTTGGKGQWLFSYFDFCSFKKAIEKSWLYLRLGGDWEEDVENTEILSFNFLSFTFSWDIHFQSCRLTSPSFASQQTLSQDQASKGNISLPSLCQGTALANHNSLGVGNPLHLPVHPRRGVILLYHSAKERSTLTEEFSGSSFI